MTQKEKENLATEIAKNELKLQNATSAEEKNEAVKKIFELSDKIETLDDLFDIEHLVYNQIKEFDN
jgi:hypothetical protein